MNFLWKPKDKTRHSEQSEESKREKNSSDKKMSFAFSMAKRCAFTLAEVLITLSILGVIATMTIPNIIQNYKKTYTETRLKKAYSILENTLEQAKVINGLNGNYDNMLIAAKNSTTSSFGRINYFGDNYLKPYINYSFICTAGQRGGKCGADQENKIYRFDNGEYMEADSYKKDYGYRIYLKNGLQIGINKHLSNMDMLTLRFFVDVNGDKKPNRNGYDIFYFYINKNDHNGHCALYNKDSTYCYPGDRVYAGAENNYFEKNRTCSGDGFNCLALIKRNGWKIPKDYPVKF